MKKAALTILLLLLFVIFFVGVGYLLGRGGGISLGNRTVEKMRKNCYVPISESFYKKAWNYDIGQIQKYMQMMGETAEEYGFDPEENRESSTKGMREEEIELMFLKRDEAVKRVREYYLELLRLRVDLANCYEKEAGGIKILEKI